MTDKTKAKIEAMAKYPTDLDDSYYEHKYERALGRKQGAIPWAEWCERFEKKLKRLKQINIPINVYDRRQMIDEILKEYRQWLKDVEY